MTLHMLCYTVMLRIESQTYAKCLACSCGDDGAVACLSQGPWFKPLLAILLTLIEPCRTSVSVCTRFLKAVQGHSCLPSQMLFLYGKQQTQPNNSMEISGFGCMPLS